MYVDRFIGNWAFKVRLFSSNNLIFTSRLFYLLIINQHFIGFFCLNWKSWKSTSFSNSFLRPVPSSVFLVQYSSFSIPSSVFLYSVFLVQYSQFSIPLSVFPVQYSQFSIPSSVFPVQYSRSSVFLFQYSQFSIPLSVFPVQYSSFSILLSVFPVQYSRFSKRNRVEFSLTQKRVEPKWKRFIASVWNRKLWLQNMTPGSARVKPPN